MVDGSINETDTNQTSTQKKTTRKQKKNTSKQGGCGVHKKPLYHFSKKVKTDHSQETELNVTKEATEAMKQQNREINQNKCSLTCTRDDLRLQKRGELHEPNIHNSNEMP